MKILIVEDDRPKLVQLSQFMKESFSDSEIDEAVSYNSGLNSVLKKPYDLLLLDMALQTFDVTGQGRGGRPRKFGGREILAQMKRKGIKVNTIVVTQFDTFGEPNEALTLDELKNQLESQYPEIYKGTVYYNSALDNWKNDIQKLVSKLEFKS